MSRKAVVLLSGGLDSATAAALAQEDGMELVAGLNVVYGQKHKRERQSFEVIADHYGMQKIELDMTGLGKVIEKSSALLNPEEELPRDRPMSSMTAHVPRSYVPGRNTIFLALAQSVAEALELGYIVIGANAVDFSGYADCRPIFVSAWNNLARYATQKGYEGRPIEVVAPIIEMSKASVVWHAKRLGVPIEFTTSCYRGAEKACGTCDSCIIRFNAFVVNGLKDPIEYEIEPVAVGL